MSLIYRKGGKTSCKYENAVKRRSSRSGRFMTKSSGGWTIISITRSGCTRFTRPKVLCGKAPWRRNSTSAWKVGSWPAHSSSTTIPRETTKKENGRAISRTGNTWSCTRWRSRRRCKERDWARRLSGSARKRQSQRDTRLLHALAISPEMQGKGLGAEIVRFCTEEAKSKGYKAFRLDIVPGNAPAQKLYEKSGFKYAGDADLDRGIAHIPVFSLYELNW